MRRAVRVATASLSLAALTCGACSREKRAERGFERELAAQLSKQLGMRAEVSCDGGEPPEADRCVAKVVGQVLPLALRREGEQVRWQLEGVVVSAVELEKQLVTELAELGVTAKPSCGAPLQAVIPGERVSCSLSEQGVAWATVHADGSYSIELALGEAQAARTHQVEEKELDDLSRALDRAAGSDDEEEADDEDGGDGAAAPASEGSGR